MKRVGGDEDLRSCQEEPKKRKEDGFEGREHL